LLSFLGLRHTSIGKNLFNISNISIVILFPDYVNIITR